MMMFRIRLKPKKSKQKEGEREIVSSDKVWDDSKENNDAQRALRLPIGINLSKHKLLIFYIFLLATLGECNFLAILGCP